MHNDHFSESISKLLRLKTEFLSQELDARGKEQEYFTLEAHFKRLLGEQKLKPEDIIALRQDLEKKKAQLLFLKKNLYFPI